MWKLGPPPTSVHELKAFLGLCNYYRKFVPAKCFYTAQRKVNFCTCARISFSGGKIHPGHRYIKSQYRGDLGTTSVGRGESYHLCKHPPHSSSDEILCNNTRVAGCCLLHPQVSTLPAWKEVSSTHRSQQPHLVIPVQTS